MRKNEFKTFHAQEIKQKSDLKQTVKRLMSAEIRGGINRYNRGRVSREATNYASHTMQRYEMA